MRKREREISEINEIKTIISQADVCRIAIANDNIPYLVTMNFGYAGNPVQRLFFHCASEGRKLEMIRKKRQKDLKGSCIIIQMGRLQFQAGGSCQDNSFMPGN